MPPLLRARAWWPPPPELAAAPELAVLAVVRAALEIAVAALLAENGPLTVADDLPLSACAQAARRVIDDAGRLTRAVDDYRRLIGALAADNSYPDDDDFPDDDIPF
jgi:hypothetical protein